ncbi:MAG: hypothetical protein WEC15_03145 [Flavobacteriales bacterium]
MKHLVLAALAFLPGAMLGQQLLFSEDFEGPTSTFVLNTTDVGSTANNDNTWLINNVYSGGTGNVVCLGFPLPFNVATTAGQPAGISNANGNYLHTTSVAAANSGVLNCCFLAADGLCANPANHFTRMGADVNTLGAGDVTLSFWWLCGGGANNYGEVYYSTNGGSSWNLISSPIVQYRNQSSWVQQNITLPEFSGHATLRFGFRFVNGSTTSAQDPGFGIDDVRITSAAAAPSTVSTGLASPTAVCQSGTINIPYTVSGSFGPANIFTAELSNATGGFAAPVVIGSLLSTASGTIVGTVPAGTAPGVGYRVRVVASAPLVVGTPNAVDIAVSEAPFAGSGSSLALCSTSAPVNLLTTLGSGVSSCGAWTGPGGGAFSGFLNPATDPPGQYTYTTNCPGGCPQDAAVVTVALTQAPNAGTSTSITLCVNSGQLSLLGVLGAATGGTWTDPNGSPFSGLLDPATAIQGVYTYTVTGTVPCSSAQAIVAVVIDPCTGIQEAATANGVVRWLGQEGDQHVLDLGEARLLGIVLLDASGRLLPAPTSIGTEGQVRIALRGVATGVHILRLATSRGEAVLRVVHVAP